MVWLLCSIQNTLHIIYTKRVCSQIHARKCAGRIPCIYHGVRVAYCNECARVFSMSTHMWVRWCIHAFVNRANKSTYAREHTWKLYNINRKWHTFWFQKNKIYRTNIAKNHLKYNREKFHSKYSTKQNLRNRSSATHLWLLSERAFRGFVARSRLCHAEWHCERH